MNSRFYSRINTKATNVCLFMFIWSYQGLSKVKTRKRNFVETETCQPEIYIIDNNILIQRNLFGSPEYSEIFSFLYENRKPKYPRKSLVLLVLLFFSI